MTMFELENSSTPANRSDAGEHKHTATLSLELRDDVSLSHHQTVGQVVNSTTAVTGLAQGRGSMDLSVAGQHDHYSLVSTTTSSSSAAAASASRCEHPTAANSDSTSRPTSLHESLKYENGLHADEPLHGTFNLA